jgi:CRISPR-associated endonuclease Cas3-HD|uniref:CRISPR-associated endonuclease Cas3 n=1 Tax=Caldisericum exile TaxID=693075 RepID=A0A7C4U3M9_9BACT
MTHPTLYSAPEERYIDHLERCRERLKLIYPLWEPTIRRIFSIGKEADFGYLLEEMIIFHDLGKLTKKWQENLGTNKRLPAHAPIGAAYLYKKFSKENSHEDLKNAILFATAIHHTDSGLLGDNIERPDVQAILDGIVDTDGKIKWADETETLDEEFFPRELKELTIEDLKNMARGLRIWARSGGILEQHKKRIQASIIHHILKLCDISAASERKEYKKEDDVNYYGGWVMSANICEYVENILQRIATKLEVLK